MRNRMLARAPKGLRPKQRVVCRIRCPHMGVLIGRAVRETTLAPYQPYGQGGVSREIAALCPEAKYDADVVIQL